ncbi:MAG: alpha/beta hydrolase-fold protein [Anaeromyxobacteraceae bacterium]
MRLVRLALPLTAALALAATRPATAAGDEEIRLVTLKSAVFGGERQVVVRTPPGYAEDAGLRYPVLYFTDGPTNLDPLAAAVRFLERHGRMPAVLLVGVVHEDRTNELTPSKVTGKDGNFPTSGGAGALLDHLEKEVVPWVERSYRTAPLRVLGGHSFGGLFALHALATRPGLFRAYLTVSPSVPWDRGMVLDALEALVKARPELEATVFASSGDEGPELARGLERLARVLRAGKGVTYASRTFPGEDHGSVVFPALHAGLEALFEGWRMPVAQGDVGPRGGFAAVEAHYRGLSRRVGYEIAPPEQALNLAGYEALRRGDLDLAVRTLQKNAERHPASANAHDSLGEAHERAGNLEDAVREYQHAVDLGAKAKDPALRIYEEHLARATAAAAAARLGGSR